MCAYSVYFLASLAFKPHFEYTVPTTLMLMFRSLHMWKQPCWSTHFTCSLVSTWSTNLSTVCVHPTLQRTAYCCLPLVVGSTCDRLANWNCLFQEHELWHLAHGLFAVAGPGLEFSVPCSKRTDSLVYLFPEGIENFFCSDSASVVLFVLIVCCRRKCSR